MELAKIALLLALCALASGARVEDGRCLAAQSIASASVAAQSSASGPPPVLVLPSTRAVQAGLFQQAHASSTEPAAVAKAVGVAEELDFDTPVGHGRWSVAPAADGKSYATVKVQFKREVAMDDLVGGTELDAPLRLGSPAMARRFSSLANRMVGPGAEVDLKGDKPFFYVPWLNWASVMYVSKEAPAGIGLDIQHDTTLIDGVGNNMAFWQKPANRQGRTFSPDFWYTLVMLERNNHATGTVYGARWLNMDRIINHQPMQYLLKDRSTDEYLISMDAWTPARAQNFAKVHCT